MSCYLGIDVGGMSVKGALFDGGARVLSVKSLPTPRGGDLAETVTALCRMLAAESGEEIGGIGIGCPGIIDSESGTVVFAGNLSLKNYPLVQRVTKDLPVPVKVTNDANAAALGEAKYGAGRNYKNSILVTLGTGVGGGIVIDGKLFEGNRSAGAEIGHMVIERGGEFCTCGRRGCWEAYSSATALIRRTKWAMEENPGSAMWRGCTSDTACGRTAFEYSDTDVAARETVEWYIKYLSIGLINLANIFRPEVIMLGGGIAGEGERLTAPVQELVDRELFGGTGFAPVKVVCASLGADAGMYGAAALVIH